MPAYRTAKPKGLLSTPFASSLEGGAPARSEPAANDPIADVRGGEQNPGVTDYSVQSTMGLVGGLTIQFAEGRYPEIGTGIAVCEEAFLLVHPCLRSAWEGWTNEAHYGVSELPAPARVTLVKCLRSKATNLRGSSSDRHDEATFFEKIADWLATRCDEGELVSILGV